MPASSNPRTPSEQVATQSPSSERHEEYQYLDLLSQIIVHGDMRSDRTGTGTLSVFAPPQFRFSLADDFFPLLTTKRVFFRGVAEELFWFIRGDTDGKKLNQKGVKIWDGNGTREFLDSRGLVANREGDLGPVYGFQWRHFGAEYLGCEDDYTGKGVDQLRQVVEKIVRTPNDRRIVLSAWNPADHDKMALPPCHMFCQFYVSTPTFARPIPSLSCLLYQRSADMGLGVPFNIASYALFTRMIAHVTGLRPGEFIHQLGDAHVYLNHVQALKGQLERVPREFPKLRILKVEPPSNGTADLDIDRIMKELEEFDIKDLEVVGYKPHASVKLDISI